MFAASQFWQADKEMGKNGEGDEADFPCWALLLSNIPKKATYPSNPQVPLIPPPGERFFHREYNRSIEERSYGHGMSKADRLC